MTLLCHLSMLSVPLGLSRARPHKIKGGIGTGGEGWAGGIMEASFLLHFISKKNIASSISAALLKNCLDLCHIIFLSSPTIREHFNHSKNLLPWQCGPPCQKKFAALNTRYQNFFDINHLSIPIGMKYDIIFSFSLLR